jgi:rhodanese-related sulfurtransferase
MKRLRTALLEALVVVVVSLLVGLAYNTVSSNGIPLVPKAAPDSTKGFSQVSVNETKLLLKSKDVLVLDSRAKEEFEFGHILGAVNLPTYDFDKTYPQVLPLLKGKKVLLVYCSGPGCELAPKLAEKLRAKGYKDIRIFEGGWPAWLKAGGQVERTQSN